MAGDLVRYAQEQSLAARMATGERMSGNLIGRWQGIEAGGQGVALVNGREVRGAVWFAHGKPKGSRCIIRVTPQGNVIQA